ncbi:MAG: zf-TFIIB domain-containing protein [Pseudomonadales bacterium]
MQCPKCQADMDEVNYGANMTVDRCTNCQGIWFDTDEAHILKGKWMSEFLDSGDPKTGKKYNEMQDVDCPRCGKRMDRIADKKQPHLIYEACEEHGMFLDAGEFTDFKHETLMDKMRDLVSRLRKRS